jgi:hypothetical protein
VDINDIEALVVSVAAGLGAGQPYADRPTDARAARVVEAHDRERSSLQAGVSNQRN